MCCDFLFLPVAFDRREIKDCLLTYLLTVLYTDRVKFVQKLLCCTPVSWSWETAEAMWVNNLPKVAAQSWISGATRDSVNIVYLSLCSCGRGSEIDSDWSMAYGPSWVRRGVFVSRCWTTGRVDPAAARWGPRWGAGHGSRLRPAVAVSRAQVSLGSSCRWAQPTSSPSRRRLQTAGRQTESLDPAGYDESPAAACPASEQRTSQRSHIVDNIKVKIK